MIRYYSLVISTMLALFTVVSCTRPPIFDEVPSIEFETFLQDSIQHCFGQTSLVISFTDGDGDLGNENGDTATYLFIVDTRLDDTIGYQIPYIEQQGVANGISGEIEVDMSNIPCVVPGFPVFCLDVANTYDSVVYEVFIKDRAGNTSNVIQTDPLSVRCFQ